MEQSAQVISVAVTHPNSHSDAPKIEAIELVAGPTSGKGSLKTSKLQLNQTTLAFFLMGILVGLPTMPITTAAAQMFEGITGVYGICLSLTAAISSFAGPMIARYVPYDVCNIALTLASALAYVISTLPDPLGNPTGFNKTGPVIGTMLAGFVYAFGTQNYLSVAAFFPSEAVIALSVGSGLSIILGAGVFIGLMNGAFDNDWRRCFLVFLPTTILMPFVWYFMFDKKRRTAAELSRKRSLQKPSGSSNSSDVESNRQANNGEPTDEGSNSTDNDGVRVTRVLRPGFGPNRTRVGMLLKKILPQYVLPLIICTTCAIFCLFGIAPTLHTLNRFEGGPKGDLEFQLVFFAYGSAQFLFSVLVAVKPVPIVWIWTGIEVALTAIALAQLWYPFLNHFWVWWVIMFMVGGCVGGGVTNTNYRISQDMQKAGEPDEVRSFANSYAGLGNFGGDALGGALGLVIEAVVAKGLKPTP
ncbi:uncharacterized protein JN550_009760 [Neoarthrinium moseri]|uniref:uncharacterized protein n=1 Tax=Neoarthrinium moseri TaxID=1658444 RepID=UPI001FDD0801|nr:uncharacterized protein JN550_009760 [Neoarthrinium moseri]KAI1863234.1 hypothetical protein JN550_009760 [Neoarthrinium moseri]